MRSGLRASSAAGRTRRPSTINRLLIGYAFVLLVVIGAIGVQSDRLLNRRMQQSLNNDLREQVSEFKSAAGSRPAGQSPEAFTADFVRSHRWVPGVELVVRIDPPPGAPAGTGPTVLSTPGARVLQAGSRIDAWMAVPPLTVESADVTVAGANLRALATPIVMADQRSALLIVADDIDRLNRDRRSQLIVVALESSAALVASLAGGYFLTRRILRVVAKVSETAEEITTSGDLSRRLNIEGPDDEFGRLGRTVDDMLDRVEAAFHGRAELLADVSHQLRTPLTIIRGHLDVLSRGGFGDAEEVSGTVAVVIDELDQLALMVERMLLLGQALERDFLLDQPIDLPAALAEVFEVGRYLGERDWVLGPVPPIVLEGDWSKLRGALLNLIDNAVKATIDGDHVSLDARVDDGLVLEVSDSGHGLDPAMLTTASGRFVRARSPGYSGAGLGLAIVKAVAEAHGGRFELDSAIGQGCTARLVLPAARIIGPAITAVTS